MKRPDHDLRSALGVIGRRWQRAEALRAGSWALFGAALVVAAAVVVGRLVPLSGPALLLLVGGSTLLAAILLVAVLLPARKRPADPKVARFVEERCPEFEDVIATAADVAARGDNSPLSPLLLAEAARRLEAVDLDRLVDSGLLRRRAIQAAAAGVLLLLVGGLGAPLALRAARTAKVWLVPTTLTLHVEPGDSRVRVGESLTIAVRVEGLPEGVTIEPPVVSLSRDERSASVPTEGQGTQFAATIPAITADFAYRVSLGRLISATYHVQALTVPRVARIDLEYRYPAFSGLAPRTERDGGDIYAPQGTKIKLAVTTNKAIESGSLVMAAGEPIALSRVDETHLEGDLVVDGDGAYRVAIADREGLDNPGETEYFIRVMDDRPPDVRILRPAGDRQVTMLEEVTIEARADDDYGVDRLELVYAVRGGAERVLPLAQSGPSTTMTGARTMFVEDFDVKPGDFVTYYARARDVGRGKRPTVAQSDIFFLEVRPFGEEFVAAQSQAMMGQGGSQFDDLAAAQKDVIIATWKIERRAAAGRSPDDIRAVARAQGELKDKAAQLALQLGGGQPARRLDGRQPQDRAGDPMALAVAAMERAKGSLDALKTGEAIPHEMEALNQLLKAQADVQRRQVAQQQANQGGGGGQRSNQDLSSLFDRELLRQKQTNYETPSNVEARAEEKTTESALDKVRDLARRQEELAKRQRDLARQRAAMNAEEVKRQLEKLTREQSELRQQAERLAQELARRQSGSSSQQSGESGQSPQDAQGRMREASNEMRTATGELRQSDLTEAVNRSQRALQRLRDVEQSLRESEPDEQRRALGELQLEAQQLAETQRRVASQAARAGDAGRPRPNTPDELRRLAGDQQRVAERTEQLQQAVGELQRQGGREQGALGAAEQELSKNHVADRMKASADALRKAGESKDQEGAGADAPSGRRFAAEQKELVASLDRVADRLGVAMGGSGESLRLSSKLSQLRDLRDRLAEAERRIEELARQESSRERLGGERSRQASNNPAEGEQRRASPGSEQGQPASESSGDRSSPRQAGRDGREGAQGDRGGSGGAGELGRLQSEYARELRQTQELLEDLRRENPSLEGNLASLERHYYSLSAPGTEAWKQDFAKWDVLRRDVRLALERLQSSLSDKMAEQGTKDRVNGGDADLAPDAYRSQVSDYYRALAKKPGVKN